jgi:hypothetical protein
MILDNLLEERGVIRHNPQRLARLLLEQFLNRPTKPLLWFCIGIEFPLRWSGPADAISNSSETTSALVSSQANDPARLDRPVLGCRVEL